MNDDAFVIGTKKTSSGGVRAMEAVAKNAGVMTCEAWRDACFA
jgi:hypothetical protein